MNEFICGKIPINEPKTQWQAKGSFTQSHKRVSQLAQITITSSQNVIPSHKHLILGKRATKITGLAVICPKLHHSQGVGNLRHKFHFYLIG